MQAQSQQMGGETKDAEDQVSSLLLVNNLDYRLAPSLSVAVTRSHASYVSSSQTYGPGQLLSCTLSSGGQYINMKESYLSITVALLTGPDPQTSPGTYTLPMWHSEVSATADGQLNPPGRNGGMNLFSSMRYVHSSGTVIDEQISDLDLWAYMRDRYTFSSDEQSSVGSLYDYGIKNNANMVFTPGGPSRQILIPMSQIADVFNQPLLMPSFIAAGSRLELRVNEVGRAFVRVDATVGPLPVGVDPIPTPVLVISNVELVLQQIQLTDSINRAISNISASSGLEYDFTSVAVNNAITSNVSGSIQVSRALSRANSAILVRRDTDALSGPTRWNRQSAAPAFQKVVNDTGGRYSVQLGGQSIPQSPVTTSKEAYFHALVAFGAAMDRDRCPTVSYQNFQGLANSLVSDAVSCISLETSSTLNQSGSALSAQRVLVFDYASMDAPTGQGATLTLFTPHVRLVTAYLDSIIARA